MEHEFQWFVSLLRAPQLQGKEYRADALSILWRQTNRSAKDGLSRPQLVSPPAMHLLRVPLQYPRKASTLESGGAEVAGGATIPEGMEEMSDGRTTWEVRGRVVRRRFQTGWDHPPCGPHCASEAHPAIRSWQSRPPRKPSVYLRILPWLQAPGRPQAVLGGQARVPRDSSDPQF